MIGCVTQSIDAATLSQARIIASFCIVITVPVVGAIIVGLALGDGGWKKRIINLVSDCQKTIIFFFIEFHLSVKFVHGTQKPRWFSLYPCSVGQTQFPRSSIIIPLSKAQTHLPLSSTIKPFSSSHLLHSSFSFSPNGGRQTQFPFSSLTSPFSGGQDDTKIKRYVRTCSYYIDDV